ncbi:MAG TPA: hypothetical protein VG032_09385 [Acidimicrobiales bacterium]|jgi:hypothetical protein|nr:hypothetical protein [Acidimicrobiales bacterium]
MIRRTGSAVLAGLLMVGMSTTIGIGTSGASQRVKASGPHVKGTGRQKVLYVGAFNGFTTPSAVTFSTIQGAVNASKPGDWILIAPGDYHEQGDMGANAPGPAALAEGWYGGVDITTRNLHVRGMNRNSVIVDGTTPSASAPCSPAPADQNSLNGDGRNGIVIWKANNVTVDNLTVCNFIAGTGNAGNEIWWNGGAGSGTNGLTRYSGSYLTATSTYFAGSDPSHLNVCGTCALYGIFSSDSSGPSHWSQLYANNFADSGMYVGACKRACNVTIDHAWMENNALGYSGTNSGGKIVIQNSRFDDNKDGLDTNTALTGDPPPPQDGRCWTGISPITGTKMCWVFTNNMVDSNNNPNVPISGTAGLGPTGTGMTISGGRYDTVTDNTFLDNGAWGVAFVPYPDGNTTSDGRTCVGTKGFVATSLGISGLSCLYDPQGNVLSNNKFSGNGTFANSTNADYANLLIAGGQPANCFIGNTQWDSAFTHKLGPAVSGNPGQTSSSCGSRTPKAGLLGSNTNTDLLLQLECDAGLLSGSLCSGANYPPPTSVVMHPLPTLASMPNPCAGVPKNLWCPGGNPVVAPKG